VVVSLLAALAVSAIYGLTGLWIASTIAMIVVLRRLYFRSRGDE
jgi:hypothetical protein